MVAEKRVRDIMVPIQEYEKIDVDARLCDALAILKKNYQEEKAGGKWKGHIHKTIFVTDSSKKIVGKVDVYDLIRGLVPDNAKGPVPTRAYYTFLTSRAREVIEDVREFQEQFQWLGTPFLELVRQVAHKGVREIMSPVKPLLDENDTINKALYVMFKENVRQPLVTRNGEISGVITFIYIFDELLEIVGPECDVYF
jgi:CBS domain-containing protein